MQIEILSLFPEAFTSFLDQAPLAPAIQKGIVHVRAHNLRSWAGASQSVLTQRGNQRLVASEPVVACVQSIVRPEQKSQTIILTPSGRFLNEHLASELSRLDQFGLSLWSVWWVRRRPDAADPSTRSVRRGLRSDGR